MIIAKFGDAANTMNGLEATESEPQYSLISQLAGQLFKMDLKYSMYIMTVKNDLLMLAQLVLKAKCLKRNVLSYKRRASSVRILKS